MPSQNEIPAAAPIHAAAQSEALSALQNLGYAPGDAAGPPQAPRPSVSPRWNWKRPMR